MKSNIASENQRRKQRSNWVQHYGFKKVFNKVTVFAIPNYILLRKLRENKYLKYYISNARN